VLPNRGIFVEVKKNTISTACGTYGAGAGELHNLVSVGKGDRGAYVKGYY